MTIINTRAKVKRVYSINKLEFVCFLLFLIQVTFYSNVKWYIIHFCKRTSSISFRKHHHKVKSQNQLHCIHMLILNSTLDSCYLLLFFFFLWFINITLVFFLTIFIFYMLLGMFQRKDDSKKYKKKKKEKIQRITKPRIEY